MLLLCAPKTYVKMPAKKPISPRPQAVKTAIHLQSTKINKNPFVTRAFRPSLRVFLHTLFLEYATETGGNKCKAVFYTYKQIGMRSLELFWPFDFSEKSRGRSCPRPFISRPLRPGLKAPLGLASKTLRP